MSASHTAPLVLSQGDPDGIGPELLLRVAAAGALRPGDRIVASLEVLDRVAEIGTPWARDGRWAVGAHLEPSPPSQVAALARAVDLVLAAPGAALVTAPIDKHACLAEGFAYPGHTEYLAARAGVGDDFAMLMAGPILRVALATIHVPLRRVPEVLTSAAIVRAGRLLVAALRRDFSIARPRVAVLGLNPHAGEQGALGHEDQQVVAPAVEALATAHPEATIVGPSPADAALPAHGRGELDAVLAMYHDQGLAAFKLLHFADGVNVTLGLPFVRTSPDHGTAKDIAHQGRADPSSMLAAIDLARRLATSRSPA